MYLKGEELFVRVSVRTQRRRISRIRLAAGLFRPWPANPTASFAPRQVFVACSIIEDLMCWLDQVDNYHLYQAYWIDIVNTDGY